jgi:hypothetical protein
VIEADAFSYQRRLSSVQFPSGLQAIGANAFEQAGLSSVDLPAGIESIGLWAFAACPANFVTIDSGNPYFTADHGALYNKNLSTLIYFPSRALQFDLVTPDATTSIGVGACYYQMSLEWIELQSVVTIAHQGFCVCLSVVDLILPATLVECGDQCFGACISIIVLELPDSVLTCGTWFVAQCESLMEFWFGNSVTYVGDAPFALCFQLFDVWFPDSIQSLPPGLFSQSYLRSVSQPGSLEDVYPYMFQYFAQVLLLVKFICAVFPVRHFVSRSPICRLESAFSPREFRSIPFVRVLK